MEFFDDILIPFIYLQQPSKLYLFTVLIKLSMHKEKLSFPRGKNLLRLKNGCIYCKKDACNRTERRILINVFSVAQLPKCNNADVTIMFVDSDCMS